MAQILDGKLQAATIREQVKERISAIQDGCPCMAVVQVGNDPASTVYIGQKEKACQFVGIDFRRVALDENISQQDMLAEIDLLNADDSVHGFIVQKPLPAQLNDHEIVSRIDPRKDIDCLNPYNVGLVAEGRGALLPCTPAGVIALLDAYEITLRGKHCVVVGRSSIVGKPLALMMLNRDATVTTIHSHTIGMADFCRQADILVVAVGKPNLITADMIKQGCVLVDVGINRLDGKLCGDVDYESCFEKASYITPVPGGVGPMTVAMLMANGLKAWECR